MYRNYNNTDTDNENGISFYFIPFFLLSLQCCSYKCIHSEYKIRVNVKKNAKESANVEEHARDKRKKKGKNNTKVIILHLYNTKTCD